MIACTSADASLSVAVGSLRFAKIRLLTARVTCCKKFSLQMNLMICSSVMWEMTDSFIHMFIFSMGISQPTCAWTQRIVRVLSGKMFATARPKHAPSRQVSKNRCKNLAGFVARGSAQVIFPRLGASTTRLLDASSSSGLTRQRHGLQPQKFDRIRPVLDPSALKTIQGGRRTTSIEQQLYGRDGVELLPTASFVL